jgi:hypothetical protein
VWDDNLKNIKIVSGTITGKYVRDDNPKNIEIVSGTIT